jgi:hypothetical protein
VTEPQNKDAERSRSRRQWDWYAVPPFGYALALWIGILLQSEPLAGAVFVVATVACVVAGTRLVFCRTPHGRVARIALIAWNLAVPAYAGLMTILWPSA